MGKKQKVVLFFLAAAIMVLSGYLPEFFLSKVPTAKAIVPSQTTYTPYISCSGTLQAENVKEILGTLFGIIPAYQAAKLDPIDALRSEI